MNAPVKVGERLVVHGITYAEARVCDVSYKADEARWLIVLDWGQFGKSRVWDHDEGKVWFRYARTN